jgi:redox-sensitive bicupin YhaK (pirin superfamily)
MISADLETRDLFVLSEDEGYVLLTARDFGLTDRDWPDLLVREIIGPFAPIAALGPLVTVHHGGGKGPGGIGHHPHRYLERLFYILSGTLDHDDALNGITGHVEPGDLMRLTEGRRGMVHSERNASHDPSHLYILVYVTDPLPERASFAALRGAQAPRYVEAPEVETKELVGRRSPLAVHGDIRLLTDTRFGRGASLELALAAGEGALLSPLEGSFRAGEEEAAFGASFVMPPRATPRTCEVHAPEGGRLMRTVFGPAGGLVVNRSPLPRR